MGDEREIEILQKLDGLKEIRYTVMMINVLKMIALINDHFSLLSSLAYRRTILMTIFVLRIVRDIFFIKFIFVSIKNLTHEYCLIDFNF